VAPPQVAAGNAGAAAATDGEAPRRGRKSRNRRRRERSRQQRQRDDGGAVAEAAPAERRPEADRPPKRGSRRRGSSRSGGDRHSGGRGGPGRDEAFDDRTPVDPAQAEAVHSKLKQMIELMGLEVTATPAGSAGGVRLELDGRDRPLLVQRDAELLGALQFVLNRMSRRNWPEAGRIQLRCNGLRGRRDDELSSVIDAAIEALERTGEPQELREMNAYERRLVHIAVRKVRGIRSISEGEGALKRVRIVRAGASAADGGDERGETEPPAQQAAQSEQPPGPADTDDPR
jgi:spoIIIJ-associated protein